MIRSQYKNSEFKLTMREVNRLISSSINFRDRLIIESLYFPALRRFEVRNLKVEDFDFERGRMVIRGKYGKIAPIPVGSIYPQYINNMKVFIGKKTTGWIFESNRRQRLTLSRINQIVSKIGKLSNVKNPNPKLRHVNPHILRHSQARHLKDLGFPIEWVQKYLRHTSFKTTADTYGTLSIDELEDTAHKYMIEDKR